MNADGTMVILGAPRGEIRQVMPEFSKKIMKTGFELVPILMLRRV